MVSSNLRSTLVMGLEVFLLLQCSEEDDMFNCNSIFRAKGGGEGRGVEGGGGEGRGEEGRGEEGRGGEGIYFYVAE